MSTPAFKTCNVCLQAKSLADFPRRSQSPDGLDYRCRSCVSKKNAAYKAVTVSSLRPDDPGVPSSDAELYGVRFQAERERDFVQRVNAARIAMYGSDQARAA